MALLRNISTSSEPDEKLAAGYHNSGDLAVLGNLYQRYMDLVYGVCLKYLKNTDEAQDAVMAIFEELVTKLRRHQVENFKSWLYTLAKNHCLMKLRQDKKMPSSEMAEEFVQSGESLHLSDVLAREEQWNQLDYCLRQLELPQRNVIELFYLKGKCYQQISDETGLPWNTVRSAIQNGRRNLKRCMEGRKQKAKTNE